jgi:hypothetical protein
MPWRGQACGDASWLSRPEEILKHGVTREDFFCSQAMAAARETADRSAVFSARHTVGAVCAGFLPSFNRPQVIFGGSQKDCYCAIVVLFGVPGWRVTLEQVEQFLE